MSLKKHSLFLGVSNGLSLGLNFISGIFLTRLLGPEGRGVLSKLEAGAGLLAQITTWKSHMGFMFFVANNKMNNRKLLGIAVIVIFSGFFLSGLVLIAAIEFGYDSILLPIGYTSGLFVIYSLILFFFTEAQIILSSFLRGAKTFKDVYASQIIVSSFRLIVFCSVFFIVGSQISIEAGVTLHLLILLISLLTTAYFFRRRFKISPDFNLSLRAEITPFFSFVSISYLSLLTNFLMKTISIWFLEYYSGTLELGYYAVAVNLSALLLIFPSTIREVFIPYLASGSRSENINNLTFFSRVSFTSILLVAIIVFLLADYLIPLIYGEEFIKSIKPFKYLLFAICATSIGIIFSSYNYGSGSPKFNFYANVVSLVLMIFLDLYLIPKYGVEGAAIASLLTYFFNSGLIFLTVIYFHKLPITNYFFVTRKDLKGLRKYVSKFRE